MNAPAVKDRPKCPWCRRPLKPSWPWRERTSRPDDKRIIVELTEEEYDEWCAMEDDEKFRGALRSSWYDIDDAPCFAVGRNSIPREVRDDWEGKYEGYGAFDTYWCAVHYANRMYEKHGTTYVPVEG